MVKRQYRPTNPDRRKYLVHRTNAKMRGIEFKLTFEEWFCWWMATGHYAERGREVGKYVMSRKGDKGAYELGNIECLQAQENSKAPHTLERRAQQLKEWREKQLTERSAENHGNKS
jgi:hypothetical protein